MLQHVSLQASEKEVSKIQLNNYNIYLWLIARETKKQAHGQRLGLIRRI